MFSAYRWISLLVLGVPFTVETAKADEPLFFATPQTAEKSDIKIEAKLKAEISKARLDPRCGTVVVRLTFREPFGGGSGQHFTTYPGPPKLMLKCAAREPQTAVEIFEGVTYGCERLMPSAEGSGLVHWARVDLAAPGIELFVTPLDPVAVKAGWQYRLRRTSAVVAEERLAVAINGTLFTSNSKWFRQAGDFARSIETVVADHDVSHMWEHTYLMWFDDRLTPHLKPSKPPTAAELGEAKWGIGGQGVGLVKGKVRREIGQTPNSRTAVAVDSERKLLFLAVGEWVSPRLILEQLASLGAQDGMLLDGGDSSSMALGAGSKGVAPGVLIGGWRPVATFLGVRARLLRDRE